MGRVVQEYCAAEYERLGRVHIEVWSRDFTVSTSAFPLDEIGAGTTGIARV
jgi:hypothetical protein